MNQEEKKEFAGKLTVAGMIVMILRVISVFVPSVKMPGYSLVVGITLFYIVEMLEKTPVNESGLRFNTVISDLKKPGVIIWVLLPVVSAVLSVVLGKLLFDNRFIEHVLGRTSSILSFDQILILFGQLVVGAFGEEIAFRGFFVGKGMKIFPYRLCALVSSLIFALAHYEAGNIAVVIYDLIGIFIDSLIYATIYRKTGNCLISIIAHLLCNVTGLIIMFAFFM